MPVSRCTSCGEDHWSYAGAPFRPYCSEKCWALRRKRAVEPEIERAQDVLGVMREHLRKVHLSANVTDWFPDCRACESLQERYAAALHEAA